MYSATGSWRRVRWHHDSELARRKMNASSSLVALRGPRINSDENISSITLQLFKQHCSGTLHHAIGEVCGRVGGRSFCQKSFGI